MKMQDICFFEPMLMEDFHGKRGFREFCDRVEMTVGRLDSTIRSQGYWRVPQRVWCSQPECAPGAGFYMLVRTEVAPEKDTPEDISATTQDRLRAADEAWRKSQTKKGGAP